MVGIELALNILQTLEEKKSVQLLINPQNFNQNKVSFKEKELLVTESHVFSTKSLNLTLKDFILLFWIYVSLLIINSTPE